MSDWVYIKLSVLRQHNITPVSLKDQDTVIDTDPDRQQDPGIWIRAKSLSAVILALRGLDINQYRD